MNITERVLEALKDKALKTREVADLLDADVAIVSGTISRLVRQERVVVVDKRINGQWTFKAVELEETGPSVAQQVADLLKTENLTVPEIAERLQIDKAAAASSLSVRVRSGEVKVVGSKRGETGRLIKVYGVNPEFKGKRRPSSSASTAPIKRTRVSNTVNKELSKQFRRFKPTFGNVMGVWV